MKNIPISQMQLADYKPIVERMIAKGLAKHGPKLRITASDYKNKSRLMKIKAE